jgi:hypothetical protein
MATRKRTGTNDRKPHLAVRQATDYDPGLPTEAELRKRLEELSDPAEMQKYLDFSNGDSEPPIYTMDDVKKTFTAERETIEFQLLPGNHIPTTQDEG